MRNFRWVVVSRLAQACSADAFHPYVQAALQAAADAGASKDVAALTAELAYEVPSTHCEHVLLAADARLDVRGRSKCCAWCAPC